jgi:hypothetical protein
MRPTIFRALASSISILSVLAFGLANIAFAQNDVIMSVDTSNTAITLQGVDSVFGTGVAQVAGSDTTSVTGHFLVQFDAVNPGGPTSVRFVPGDGSSAYNNTAGGVNLQPLNQPANFGLQGSSGTFGVSQLAARNLSWDWQTGATPVDPSGQFGSSALQFTVLSGVEQSNNGNSGSRSFNIAGFTDHLSSGTSSLVKSGSDLWTLNLNFSYSNTQSIFGIAPETTTLTYGGTIRATAHYSASNVAAVIPATNPMVSVLGGTSQPGGITATFGAAATPGTFSAEQIPLEGLSTAGVSAESLNHAFALSLNSFGGAQGVQQVWNVEYSGQLNGPVTLTFDYDPSTLPAGTDQTKLGIWHFISSLDQWQFGGTVDTVNHTITVTTNSFSPFVLGVPEPSSLVLAAFGFIGLAAWCSRRRWGDQKGMFVK